MIKVKVIQRYMDQHHYISIELGKRRIGLVGDLS